MTDRAIEQLRQAIAACRDTRGLSIEDIKARSDDVRRIALTLPDDLKALQRHYMAEVTRLRRPEVQAANVVRMGRAN